MGEILGAHPIGGADSVVRLAEKTSYFIRQVGLCGIQLLAIYELQIFFGDDDVRAGAALGVGQLFCRQLRRNLRRRGFRFSLGFRCLGLGGRSRPRLSPG